LNLLALIFLIPLLSAAALALPYFGFDRAGMARRFSLSVSLITLLLAAIAALEPFDWSKTTLQMTGSLPWVEAAGLTFSWGVDAISMWLVLLAALLTPVAVMATKAERIDDEQSFFFWLMLLETAMLGTFMATDAILLYACFELTLVPVFFMIRAYGHHKRFEASKIYFVYLFAGSLMSLASIVYVAWWHQVGTGEWSFYIPDLYAAHETMSVTQQAWVFAGLLIGFGVKFPLWPVHTWVPLTHEATPRGGSVDVAGLVIKLGPYGLLRLAIPMAPEGAALLAPYIGIVAVVGILAAALIAWVQTDAKRLLAYSSVSHMGFCALGLFAFDDQHVGAVGATFYMINYSLAAGGMFLLIGIVHDRFDTRELRGVGGLARVMPVWGFFMVFFAMASVGLPGLNGFVGEFLSLVGAFTSQVEGYRILAIVGGVGIILAAIYLLYALGLMVFGPLKLPAGHESEHTPPRSRYDLTGGEIVMLAPIALACLFFGVLPHGMLSSLEPTVSQLTEHATQAVEVIAEQDSVTADPLAEQSPVKHEAVLQTAAYENRSEAR